jgi:hypothetical protein
MSQPPSSGKRAGRPKRHPLLFQQRLNEQTFANCVLILIILAAVFVLNPPRLDPVRANLAVVMVGTGLILVLTFLFRLRAYAQCQSEGLKIQLPFYSLTIPYQEIKGVRPTELFRMFPPEKQKWSPRHFLRSLFGETVVVIELEELPSPEFLLRLWMSKYMLCPDTTGLNLAVRDWLDFRTELDEHRARHRTPKKTDKTPFWGSAAT